MCTMKAATPTTRPPQAMSEQHFDLRIHLTLECRSLMETNIYHVLLGYMKLRLLMCMAAFQIHF